MVFVSSWSCLCAIHWSQMFSREWTCTWSSADKCCSDYIWVINNSITYNGAAYIRSFTPYIRGLTEFFVVIWKFIKHVKGWISSKLFWTKLQLQSSPEAVIKSTHLPHWQNDCHFVNNIIRCIFVNEKFCILIQISLKFVPKVQLTITQHWFE